MSDVLNNRIHLALIQLSAYHNDPKLIHFIEKTMQQSTNGDARVVEHALNVITKAISYYKRNPAHAAMRSQDPYYVSLVVLKNLLEDKRLIAA